MLNIRKEQRALFAGGALLALGVLGGCATPTATTGATGTGAPRVYVEDTRQAIVKDPFGLCWRTGFWTPAQANCECDKDLLPKEKCEPPAPRVAEAPPAPPPPPPPAPKPVTEKVTLAADVLFDFDKAVLRPEGKAKLDDLVGKIKALNLEVVIAIGHTDRIGSKAYNQRLSERRAAAVKTYLVSQGIEPNRIYTEGKGLTQPVKDCPNPSPKGEIRNSKQLIACLQPNRRVDVEVVGTRTTTK